MGRLATQTPEIDRCVQPATVNSLIRAKKLAESSENSWHCTCEIGLGRVKGSLF
eukprot:s23_g11.t1